MRIVDGVRRYGAWAGNPKGIAEDPTRCVEEIHYYQGNWPHHKQCDRKRGHGPDGLHCRQHSPDAKAAREVAQKRRDRVRAIDWHVPLKEREIARIARAVFRQTASMDDLERAVNEFEALLEERREIQAQLNIKN